jgi:hypothetical protein
MIYSRWRETRNRGVSISWSDWKASLCRCVHLTWHLIFSDFAQPSPFNRANTSLDCCKENPSKPEGNSWWRT